MTFLRASAVAAAVSLFALLTGCATTHGNLSSSAERLERNADALARDTRGYDTRGYDSPSGYPAGYTNDARELADEAHDFRRTVADSRADRRDVDSAFQQLSRRYHAVRDEVDRSNSREAERDLRPVTEAYLDVERAMGGYSSDRRRYAGDRDPYDR
jgi:hypothetical protein